MYDFAPMLGRLPDSVDAIRHASQSIRLHGTMPLSRFERLRSSLLWGAALVALGPRFVCDSQHRFFVFGALIAAASAEVPGAKWLGLAGIVLASINIFGGFAVTARMLKMYQKKER